MSNAQTTAYRIRWLLLVVALLCWLVGILYIINIAWPDWNLGLPFSIGKNGDGYGLQGVMGCLWDSKGAYWCLVGFYLGVFLLTQWFFLCPQGTRRIYASATGRPMGLSLAIGAFMAALLTVGLLATILQIAGRWDDFIVHLFESKTPGSPGPGGNIYSWPPLAALAVAWGAWIVLFWLYYRQRDRFTPVGKILRGLIGGSILELLIAGPAQALSKGEEDCHCARGSYTGLVLGITVLLWCFGPGIGLLFIREKLRREKQLGGERYCPGCGYDLRASTERCPECGLPIPPTAGSGSAALGAGENPPPQGT